MMLQNFLVKYFGSRSIWWSRLQNRFYRTFSGRLLLFKATYKILFGNFYISFTSTDIRIKALFVSVSGVLSFRLFKLKMINSSILFFLKCHLSFFWCFSSWFHKIQSLIFKEFKIAKILISRILDRKFLLGTLIFCL